ncbi:MAG: hypothetical protein ACOCUT_04115, partial [bacterium]
EYDVDSEYNRDGDVVKTRDGETLINPDVIVHTRGAGNPNLVVIELKKKTNRDRRIEDVLELKYMTNPEHQYRYQLGLFIDYGNTRDSVKITSYRNGEVLTQ